MKRINKIISLLLTLMMLLSLCSFTAIAEDGNGQTDDIQGGGAETVSSTNDLPDIGGVDVTNDTTEFRVTPSSDSITITTTITTDPAEPSNPVKQGNVMIKADIIAPVDYGLYEENNTSDNLKVTVAGSIDSSISDAVNVVNKAGTNVIAVGGSVTGAADGIDATVTGGNTTINVKGDVEASFGSGINNNHVLGGGTTIEGDLTVSVGGSVIASGNGDHYGIYTQNHTGDTNISVRGDVNGIWGIYASNGSGDMTIEVGGDVESYATNLDAVRSVNGNIESADKGSMKIHVGKNINGSIYTSNSNSGTTVIQAGGDVEGNIKARNLSGSTTIRVAGDVEGRDDGIEILNESGSTDISVERSAEGKSGDGVHVQDSGKKVTVTVGGSVTGEQDGIEVIESTGSTAVTVNGDAIGETGAGVKLAVNDDNPTADADGDCGSTILVGGNAEGKEAGILVEIQSASDPNQQNAIVVEGTVTGDHAIKLNVADTVNEDAVINAIPEIIVQTLDPKADMVAVIGGDKVDAEKVKQQVLDQVKYIVDTNVNTTQVDNLVIEIYTLTEDGRRAELDTESVTGKNLTVATTGTKLIVSATTGSLVGVSISTENNNNSVTYNEATGQYEITVGIGGGLKFTATPKKADNNNSDPKPDDKPKEETTARKENADTSATAANNNALISLDYKNHILSIDMTTTPAQIFLTDTICRFQRNGFETVVIKVANGSFTVAMDDLVQMIGTAFSFTLKVAGDTLSISAGGNEIATLVMA